MSNILKLPNQSRPKTYKEAQEEVNKWLLKLDQKKDDEEVEISTGMIPYFFLLTEDHINLPDMNLEELKMVFPYYFQEIADLFCFKWTTFPVSEIKKMVRLSQTKRIPLVLGKLFEQKKFGGGSKGEKLKQSLEALINQEDPAVIESYMPLILEAGLFPGVDLKQWNIQTWAQLVELWKHYDTANSKLQTMLYRYSSSNQKDGIFSYDTYHVYEGDVIEVEWKIMEFLQTRLSEWEKREPLSKDEEKAMDTLAAFVEKREWSDTDAVNLSILFEGDLTKTKAFLEKNQEGRENIIFDKQSLYKVLSLAKGSKAVFDKEENGKLLTKFLKIEEQGLKKVALWYGLDIGLCWYEVHGGDVTVTMHLKNARDDYMNLEQLVLDRIHVDGLSEELEIIICEREEEYHPILCYADLWDPIRLQQYSKMIIKGEKEIEIPIPRIVSIEESTFDHINLKTLEIRGTVEKISCENNNSMEEIRLLSDVKLGNQAFRGCSNLKKAVLPYFDRNYGNNCRRSIPVIFEGCSSLVSIIGSEGEELLEPSIDNLRDKNESLPVDKWLDKKVIYQKDFLWWPKIIESGAEVLIYDAEDNVREDDDREEILMEKMKIYNEADWPYEEKDIYSCDSLKEVRMLEGTKILGREFSQCHNLQEIALPDSLQLISYKAFEECPLLGNIPLPPSAVIKRDEIFYYGDYYGNERFDTSIYKKFKIPENHDVYRMQDSILYADGDWDKKADLSIEWTSDDLEGTVVIPEGVNRICEFAFQNCKKMTEVVLPASLKTIEKGAFAGCSSLKKVVIRERHLQVEDKKNSDLWYQRYHNYHYRRAVYDNEIHESLFRIDPNRIFSPEVELEYTDLPTGTLKIPEGTFYIPNYEYRDCKGITELILPKSLTMIDKDAFKECTGIRRVIVNGKEPWKYPEEVFGKNVPKIEVPNSKKDKPLTYRPFANISDLLNDDKK